HCRRQQCCNLHRVHLAVNSKRTCALRTMRRMRAEIRGMAALRPCKWKREKLYRKFQREYRHCPASPDFGPTSKRRGAVARFLDRTTRKKIVLRIESGGIVLLLTFPFLARIWRLVIEISKPPHNAL